MRTWNVPPPIKMLFLRHCNTVYKIPQRNLRPSTVRIQVDIEGGTQDGVTDIGIVTDIGCYQITQCDVGVSCIQRSCSTVMAHAQSVMYTSIRACFLYFFYNPYMSLSFIIILLCLPQISVGVLHNNIPLPGNLRRARSSCVACRSRNGKQTHVERRWRTRSLASRLVNMPYMYAGDLYTLPPYTGT